MQYRPKDYGAVVEVVEHPNTHRKGEIRLQRRGMEFAALVPDDETVRPFTSTNGAEAKGWLMTQLARTKTGMSMRWRPVIQVEVRGNSRSNYRDDDPDSHVDEEVQVRAWRYWLALTSDGREWRKLEWNEGDPESPAVVPEDERYVTSRHFDIGPRHESTKSHFHQKPFRLPSYRGEHDTVLEYTPELWAAVKGIEEQIFNARTSLAEMIRTKAGVAALLQLGAVQLRLAAGSPPADPSA